MHIPFSDSALLATGHLEVTFELLREFSNHFNLGVHLICTGIPNDLLKYSANFEIKVEVKRLGTVMGFRFRLVRTSPFDLFKIISICDMLDRDEIYWSCHYDKTDPPHIGFLH